MSRREARDLGSGPGRERERGCLPLVVLEPEGLRALKTKNEAYGQETPSLFLALTLGI